MTDRRTNAAIALAALLTLASSHSDYAKKLVAQEKKTSEAVRGAGREVDALRVVLQAEAQGSTQAARRAQCTNNLKQIGLAIHTQARALQDLLAKHDVGKQGAEAAGRLANEGRALSKAAEAFPKSSGPGVTSALEKLAGHARASETLMKTVTQQTRQVSIVQDL